MTYNCLHRHNAFKMISSVPDLIWCDRAAVKTSHIMATGTSMDWRWKMIHNICHLQSPNNPHMSRSNVSEIIFHNFLHSSKASASQIRLQRFGDKKGNPLSFFKPESFLGVSPHSKLHHISFYVDSHVKRKIWNNIFFSDETEFKGLEECQEIKGTGSEDYSPTNILVNY